MKPNEFIDLIKDAAVEVEYKNGIPAAVLIAQSILESGWGESELAKQGNAMFGIKYSTSWPLKDNALVIGKYTKTTTEWRPNGTSYTVQADFCKYANAQDSIRDYGNFMQKDRYLPALEAYKRSQNPDNYARDIFKAGYATTPGYDLKLIDLMDRYDLRQYKPGQQNLTPLLDRIAKLEADLTETNNRLTELDYFVRRKLLVYDSNVRNWAAEVSRQ